jgi:hypothetical protein
MSINIRAAPSFEAVGRLFEAADPFTLKAQEVSPMDSWRADSQSLSMAPARNYPMCENAKPLRSIALFVHEARTGSLLPVSKNTGMRRSPAAPLANAEPQAGTALSNDRSIELNPAEVELRGSALHEKASFGRRSGL